MSIGHTDLIHSYLVDKEPTPRVDSFNIYLIVKQTFAEYRK